MLLYIIVKVAPVGTTYHTYYRYDMYDATLIYLPSSLFASRLFVPQVKDGRWASTKIPAMRPNNPGHIEPDVYGKLRSPWVVNSRP